VLHAYAAFLATPPGRALVRATFRALIARGMPLVAVEAIAARVPTASGKADASPILVPLDPRASVLRGPLAGATVVVKDSVDVAGSPTGLGLEGPGDHADADAILVRRIREAGGLVVGKTTMTELGMDGIGSLMPGEMPDSAVAPGYLPGGSSTGTAIAVASGLARYGVGGDGLGSVRIPSAFAGLVGLKPGRGALPHEGYRSVAPSMDEPGPMARDVADCARLFFVMAGQKDEPVSSRPPVVVGLVEHLGPEIASTDQRRSFVRLLDAMHTPRRAVTLAGAAGVPALAVAVSTEELSRSAYAARTRSGQGRLNVVLGTAMRVERRWLEARRAELIDAVTALLGEVEVLAMPTTAVPPPAATPGLLAGGQDLVTLRSLGAYTPLANLCGLAAITVPSGRDARGRPLATMFMGLPGSERRLLEIAAAAEATGLGTKSL
jgi:Asp-tRNA(Asn)/Glu-tRNA(Gln) amidotransferase A subunit family amidase